MERLGIRFFLISLACVICAPAVFAQNGKLIKGVAKGLGRTSAAEGIVKTGARNLPGAAAYSAARGVQTQLQFPGEPVQLTIPFPEEIPAAAPALLPMVPPAPLDLVHGAKLTQLLEKQAQEPAVLTLPSGERARIVKLEARHFKKTHKLNSTIGHYAGVEKNPVVLIGRRSGEKITVFKNDRLRYFSDVKRVCPKGSYLLRYESGKTAFVTPEQAPESLVKAYDAAYKKLHPNDDLLPFILEFSGGPQEPPQAGSLAELFTKKSFGTRVYTLERHPLNGETVQVAVLERWINVPGLPQLFSGSMIVLYRDGTFDIHPEDRVPPVLKDKVDAVRSKTDSPAVRVNMSAPGRTGSDPVVTTVKTYDSQARLAQDLHASGAQGRRYKSKIFGDVIIYEIPAGTYYHPAGRPAKLLDPSEQVMAYYPAKHDGQLMGRGVLTEGDFIPVK